MMSRATRLLKNVRESASHFCDEAGKTLNAGDVFVAQEDIYVLSDDAREGQLSQVFGKKQLPNYVSILAKKGSKSLVSDPDPDFLDIQGDLMGINPESFMELLASGVLKVQK